MYPSETVPKNCRGRKTFKIILLGHHHLDTKTRQRYYNKKKERERKLQTNITDEHRIKNPQQNISNPYSTIH